MESLEELSEEETPREPTSSSSPSWKLTGKEILATKTQNYFAQTKRTKNILIQVAFSIGLSSIWRFPYLCHRNGGGSFILMYFFMLLLFGIPLLYMEMIMGHWLRVDNIRVWKQLIPWLGGIGYASILVCILMSLYKSIIITWSLSYLGNSFANFLPWNQCPLVKTINVTDLSCLQTVSHQYFWYHTTLSASGHIEEGVEALVLHLILGIFAAWCLLFLTMITGLKTSMPLSAWASLDLWRQAGGHVLYSLGLGMGTTINFSSYKGGEDNYIQMASLVALVNLGTSLLVTSIIFIVLGFWATTSGPTCVEKSVSKLMNLIKKGVLPQDAKPPEDILLLPSLDYLEWISNLPQHLQYQVIHSTPSCSIKTQKEKVRLWEQEGASQRPPEDPGGHPTHCLRQATVTVMSPPPLFHGGSRPGIRSLLPSRLVVPWFLFLGHPLLLGPGHHGAEHLVKDLGRHCLSPPELHLHLQEASQAAVRVREEIFSDLGRPLWSFFTVLWCYVTLPGLLALTTICLMQLYQTEPPHYIAWNSSMSQEVKQPYLRSTLGWVTLLSILTFLPIPVYSLQHWWYLQDHIASDPFEKLQSKKMPLVPPKPLQLPKRHVKSQEGNSESSSKKLSLPLIRGLNQNPWRFSLPLSRNSQSSSWFSLPVITSLTSTWSIRSLSLPASRQVSPASTAIDNSDQHTGTKEEKRHENSVQ
ncbi:orphan sodium- and chloride-dependent neurotransmitter transporter NTT5 [Halichoerus grypus]